MNSCTPGLPKPVYSFSSGFLHAHLEAYRYCNERLIEIVQAILVNPLAACLNFSRKLIVVDYCIVNMAKGVNLIAIKVFHKPLDPHHLKTFSQQRLIAEIDLLKAKLPPKSLLPQLCASATHYMHALIPQLAAENMVFIPSFIETLVTNWGLYQVRLPTGIAARYINRHAIRQLNYREHFFNSPIGKYFERSFMAYRYKAAEFLLGTSHLGIFVNFEHFFLTNMSKERNQGDSQRIVGIIVKSLAKSLSHVPQIEAYLGSLELDSKEEQMIERLTWLQEHHLLPEGLPDPIKISLNKANLTEKLDGALNAYLSNLLEQFLPTPEPGDLLKAKWLLYALEGKDALVQIGTFLISEFGFKQLTDPHRFALAILYASGVEIAEYELDGFGRGQKPTILAVGREMMNSSSKYFTKVISIFEKSGLRNAPESSEGIQQKRAVRKHLKEHITSLLYEIAKGEKPTEVGGMLKTMREKASRLPILGMATLTLHLLINGTLFSFGYLFQEKEKQTNYLAYMLKQFTSRQQYEDVAERILELIYHPYWHIILVQLLNDLIAFKEHRSHPKSDQEEEIAFNDFKIITNFLYQHFSKTYTLSGGVQPLFHYFADQTTFDLFKETFKPSDSSPFDKIAPIALPTIHELHLFTRLTTLFRKKKIAFQGDAKFWEVFIRETLNTRIDHAFHDQPGTLAERTLLRDKQVQRLLKLSEEELIKNLGELPADKHFESSTQLAPIEIREDHLAPLAIPSMEDDFVMVSNNPETIG